MWPHENYSSVLTAPGAAKLEAPIVTAGEQLCMSNVCRPKLNSNTLKFHCLSVHMEVSNSQWCFMCECCHFINARVMHIPYVCKQLT